MRNFVLLIVGAIGLLSCSASELEETPVLENELAEVPAENKKEEQEETAEPEEEPVEEAPHASYQWVAEMQLENGLMESTENSDFVSLYDNSLTALVFIQQGEIKKAENILDFFEQRINTELLEGSGGYFQFRNAQGSNGSRRWLGDNAWLLIAIHNYHAATGNQKYHHMAASIESWIRSLQDEDGGLWGGENEDGTQIHKVTEGIVTAFNAVPGYDAFHEGILNYLKQNRWNADEGTLMAWPENTTHTFALDLLSIGQGVFKNFPQTNLYKGDEWFLTTQIATVSGTAITGYCFDADKDVVWLEGTAQMALAFKTNGDLRKSETLLAELEKSFIGSATISASHGIPYTTNFGSTYGANDLWDHADITPALSSTAWYLMAKSGFDPFEVGYEKDIPLADMFWISQ